jgi:hypothetical protein
MDAVKTKGLQAQNQVDKAKKKTSQRFFFTSNNSIERKA